MRSPNFVIVLTCLFATIAQRVNGQTVFMAPIPENNDLSPKIINGTPAKRVDWPVTLSFPIDAPVCTATVVGERAVVTAAHCVDNRGSARVLLGNVFVDLTCYHHPEYNDHPVGKPLPCHRMTDPADIATCTADVALCIATQDKLIPASTGRFERIKRSQPGATAGKQISLLGYGCTIEGGAMTTIVQVGVSKVTWTSTPGASANPRNTYKEFIKTAGQGACRGDSGGAGYSSPSAASREIIGINSRGNNSTDSYIVNVLDPRVMKFFTDLSTKNNIKICGLDAGARNCLF